MYGSRLEPSGSWVMIYSNCRNLIAVLPPSLSDPNHAAFPANAALFLGVESGKKVFDNFVWKE